MSKFFLAGLSGILLLLSCSRSDELTRMAQRSDRKATFEIFTTQDYSGKLYNDAFAEVQLRITRSEKDGRKKQTLWDTSFSSRNWSEYPREGEKIILEKSALVDEATEMLTVSTIIYFTQDSKPSLFTRVEDWRDNDPFKRFVVSF